MGGGEEARRDIEFCNSDDWQGYDDYQFYLLNYTNRPTLHERRLKIDGK
jgi:hypothetical protein